MFLIHQVREVNKYQWKKANSALCRYLSLTIPVAGCRRLSWLKNQFRRHAATDIWVKGKLSLALMGNGNPYVHVSLSELCNYQIYYKFDNYTKFQFSLLLILYCMYEHAGSSLHAVKLCSLEESILQPLSHALPSPSRQQKKGNIQNYFWGISLGLISQQFSF